MQNYDYHTRVMAGERVPISADDPQPGYYQKGRAAIRIRTKENGQIEMKINGDLITDRHALIDTWLSCAGRPVSATEYNMRLKTGRWSAEQAAVDQRDTLAKQITDFQAKYKAASEAKLDQQIDADILAGYVQQGRALIKSAKEVEDAITAPIKAELEVAKALYSDPVKKIDALNKKALSKLTEFGVEAMRKANDPDFKWAAGKAGAGKTIALRGADNYEVSDINALIEQYGLSEEAVAAVHQAVTKLAIADAKAGKTVEGLTVTKTYSAT